MANPYHYGTPVEGDQFAGREQELEALLGRMRNGISVVLISPRRYGKTSLLQRAAATLAKEKAAVVTVNVLRSRDAAHLAARLATGAFRIRGTRWHRVRQAVPEFLRRLRVAPSVTFDDDGSPRFSFGSNLAAADVDAVIADVYALLADEARDRPAVLVLDEFQAITDLGSHLPTLLKALADEHGRVSLVLAGSKKHLMERLVTSRDAPLYQMAERFSLDPLPAEVMTRYLRRRARAGNKPMSAGAAEHLVALAGPVPNDIQHLAYETFDVTEQAIEVADVDRGMAMAVAHEASLHADRYEALALGQRRVLALLAAEAVAEPYSAAFARRAGLANAASVSKALSALETAELVTRRAGRWSVADPFFAGWLRQTA